MSVRSLTPTIAAAPLASKAYVLFGAMYPTSDPPVKRTPMSSAVSVVPFVSPTKVETLLAANRTS